MLEVVRRGSGSQCQRLTLGLESLFLYLHVTCLRVHRYDLNLIERFPFSQVDSNLFRSRISIFA